MKGIVLPIIIIFSLFFFGCSSSKFVLTGEVHPSLSLEHEVKVFFWGAEGNYVLIGIVEILDVSLEKRIEEAKRIARIHGGDIIIPKGIYNEHEKKKSSTNAYLIQDFLILKSTKRKLVSQKKKPIKGKESSPPIDLSNIPRATFKMLLQESESLKGQKFRGALYPTKFSKIPQILRPYTKSDEIILTLKTKSGKYKLLLLITNDIRDKFSEMIKSKKKLTFIYTPITVYKSKYPVLKFLSTIKE